LGKSFVVTTRDDFAAEEVARAFRQHYVVENAFQQLKDPKNAIRSIYHWVDSSIRDHVLELNAAASDLVADIPSAQT
jgi:transposase